MDQQTLTVLRDGSDDPSHREGRTHVGAGAVNSPDCLPHLMTMSSSRITVAKISQTCMPIRLTARQWLTYLLLVRKSFG
jgi:hypothetical protein